MTCHFANDNALHRNVQQPAAPSHGNRSIATRARVLIACALTAVVALLVLVVWLNNADWRRLLLFGAIVGVAALRGSRAASVAASRPSVDAAGPRREIRSPGAPLADRSQSS